MGGPKANIDRARRAANKAHGQKDISLVHRSSELGNRRLQELQKAKWGRAKTGEQYSNFIEQRASQAINFNEQQAPMRNKLRRSNSSIEQQHPQRMVVNEQPAQKSNKLQSAISSIERKA